MTPSRIIIAAVSGGAALALAAFTYSLIKQKEEEGSSDVKALKETLQNERARADEYELKYKRETKLRSEERAGRTAAEKEARKVVQAQQQASGYNFKAIGFVRSCFKDRRGTPRQGSLAPSTRADIVLAPAVPNASLENLSKFSHLWVIFVFHENTNAAKAAAHGGEYYTSVPAKVAPPRLGGDKVGLFSTRTPHRPNPIGLTVVSIHSVSIEKGIISIRGHDLVDQTPVLDVKPYIPYDSIPDAVVPDWVPPSESQSIVFDESACTELSNLVEEGQLELYDNLLDIRESIEQVLRLDIRSIHQGRGKASEKTYKFRLDNVEIEFRTESDCVRVLRCLAASSKAIAIAT